MVKPERSSARSFPAPDRSSDAKYKGVRKRKWGKWVSEIRLPNSRERIWLGSYDTPQKAARAFDAALFCLRGPTAKFNFPDQLPDIPGGTSLPRSEIQAAAARFANSGQLPPSSSSSPNCTTVDDHSTTSSSSSSSFSGCCFSSPSPSVSDGAPYTPHHQVDPTIPSTFLNDLNHMNLENNSTDTDIGVPDFGIYPGFDDYFMTNPTTTDYEEENYDGIYLQGPSFLWNF